MNETTGHLEQQYNLHTDGDHHHPAEAASCNSNDTPVGSLHNSFENSGSKGSAPLLGSKTSGDASTSIKTLLTDWFYQSAWPGMGLFGESYLLFSIGTLKPLWEELFPECFSYETCSPRLLDSLAYSVVLGVICGMLVVGYLANDMGRRRCSILTATLMSVGGVGLCLVSTFLSHSPVWLYRSMSVLMFVFGLGVGGEYPLSASSASERAIQHHLKQSQIKAMDELERLQQAEAEAAEPQAIEESEYPQEIEGHPRNESADSDLTNKPSKNPKEDGRGRRIQLVFTMQGLGIWFNSLVLMLLLLITDQTGKNGYDHDALLIVWRISYLIGASVLLFVLVTRLIYLGESKVWVDDKQRRDQQQHARSLAPSSSFFGRERPKPPEERTMPPAIETNCSSVSSLSNPTLAYQEYDDRILKPVPSTEPEEDLQASHMSLLIRNFGVRLLGASTSWLLWDIAFYGNKLFQSTFLLALTGEDTTLLEFMAAAFLNATVSLLGYFAAAVLIDNPNVGRLRLQAGGFLITGMFFVMCGFTFDQLSKGALVTLYLASGFFGQLGPNATTFLIPAEIFPTEMRTQCHGICAASGKLGALIAAILFNFLNRDVDLFLLSGYASFLGCLITVWTIPELSGLDILEIDRKWRMTLDGRKRDYAGPANHPDNLSMYERWKLGLHY
jgi:MFS family permease